MINSEQNRTTKPWEDHTQAQAARVNWGLPPVGTDQAIWSSAVHRTPLLGWLTLCSLSVAVLCTGCAGTSPANGLSPDAAQQSARSLSATTSAEERPETPVARLGLFLARGSLFQAPEFEQYRLNGSTLFAECGVVRSGRPQARDRHIIQLTDDELVQIRASTGPLPSYLRQRASRFESPGSSLGFSDPGQATIRVDTELPGDPIAPPSDAGDNALKPEQKSGGTIEVKTSLDQLASEPKSSPLRRLVTALRKVTRESLSPGPSETAGLCENPTFYGIE